MDASQHYAEAERLLAVKPLSESGELDALAVMALTAEAQVHATLALAAATALSTSAGRLPDRERSAWQAVAGVTPASK